jgi:hypothetical protein
MIQEPLVDAPSFIENGRRLLGHPEDFPGAVDDKSHHLQRSITCRRHHEGDLIGSWRRDGAAPVGRSHIKIILCIASRWSEHPLCCSSRSLETSTPNALRFRCGTPRRGTGCTIATRGREEHSTTEVSAHGKTRRKRTAVVPPWRRLANLAEESRAGLFAR